MYAISQLGRKFGLSRSTLLYYESIDLLVSSELGEYNHRLYSDRDEERLERICLYRDMGIPLKKIKQLLGAENDEVHQELERQLARLNEQIKTLRSKQQAILRVLQNEQLMGSTRLMNKNQWIDMFRNAGMSDENMAVWHREFEKNAPEAHQDFLESIGLSEEKIKEVRRLSMNGEADNSSDGDLRQRL